LSKVKTVRVLVKLNFETKNLVYFFPVIIGQVHFNAGLYEQVFFLNPEKKLVHIRLVVFE